jgi:hypothetical protein
MTEPIKDELKKSEEEKKAEEKPVEKSEEKVTEDELLKAITSLEEIVKARPEEEEEEPEKEKEEEEEKSFTGNFAEDETLEKAIEVSDFLSALVDQAETSIGALANVVTRLEKSMTRYDEAQITALKEVGNVIKASTDGLTAKLDGFDARLKTIEETPARGAKSVLKSAKVIEKPFGKEGAEGVDKLTKREILGLMEKAITDKKLPDSKLLAFEASNIISDETKDILKSYL